MRGPAGFLFQEGACADSCGEISGDGDIKGLWVPAGEESRCDE